MTHSEKNYLAKKINQVVEEMINDRIEGIESLFQPNDGMPF